MIKSDANIYIALGWEELQKALTNLHRQLDEYQEIYDGPSAEVVVAGIEGRAIVRAGMQRELRFIGEA